MRFDSSRLVDPAREIGVAITHERNQLIMGELAHRAVKHIPADPASVISRVTTGCAPLCIIGVVFGHHAPQAPLNHISASFGPDSFELGI